MEEYIAFPFKHNVWNDIPYKYIQLNVNSKHFPIALKD